MSLRVADVSMFLSPTGGGISRYLREKQRWLAAEGIEHLVIAPTKAMPGVTPAGPSVPAGFGYRLPIGLGSARAALLRFAPDIVEIGDPYHLGWSALRAARDGRARVVAFCHSDVAAMAGRLFGHWLERPARSYLHGFYSRCDRVLAPSRAVAAQLEAIGLDNVEVQPLGVDLETFSPERARPAAWRLDLALPPDARIALYVGRFAAEKNLQAVADAIARLDERHHLVAIGAGPKPPHGPRVHLREFEGDSNFVARAMASSDLFVHGGDQETFGLAALEAMACGTPVVAPARAGLAELVDDRVGCAVHDLTPEAFAQAIAGTLARDRGVLSAAARARAAQLGWPRVFASMVARYRALVDDRAALAA